MSNKTNIDLSSFNFDDFKSEALEQLKSGQTLTGKNGILTPLIKELLEASLEGEIESHLSDCREIGKPNRRNGKLSKRIQSDTGSFSLNTPRDIDGSFEPEIIKKRQTVLNESLDNKILALYGLGMSYDSISEHLADMYGLEVSSSKISMITDKLLPMITEWRNRPLDSIYPIVFLDDMHFKVRVDGKVVTRAFYTVLAVTNEGTKDILGLYLSEAEGARFWLGVLNDIKARGVDDILIASIDGLKGFPEAIAEVFPKTEVQLCVVHQIRNSLKYVVSKEQKAFMTDLKLVYKATSKDLAEQHLLDLEEK